jgi:HK97 family phage major capsid protein
MSLVGDSQLLPETLVADIFSKAKTESVLMTLGQQVPVSLGQTTIPVPNLHKPAAGQVGVGTTFEQREGHEKPITGFKYGSRKSFMPIKLAVIVTASREFALVNPQGLWSQLATDLPAAIARAADLAVVYGRDALRGTPLQGIAANGYITETDNIVDLNLAAQRVVNETTGAVETPDAIDQFIEAWRLVNGPEDTDYELNYWAYAPEITPDIVTARRSDGTPLWRPAGVPSTGSEINLSGSVGGSILGINAQPHKIVTGKVDNSAKTNVRVIGGDFSQLAYGYADQISFRISDQATLPSGTPGEYIDLFSTNQVAVLCEATFGWLVHDPNAFVTMRLDTNAIPGDGI